MKARKKGDDPVQQIRRELDLENSFEVFKMALEYALGDDEDSKVIKAQAKEDVRNYRINGKWTDEVSDFAIDLFTGRFNLELAVMYGPGDENAPPENGDETEGAPDD